MTRKYLIQTYVQEPLKKTRTYVQIAKRNEPLMNYR